MLHEYAVDPTALGRDQQTCDQLFDLFGFHRGRVIATMPREWAANARDVISAIPTLGEVTRKRLIERLRKLQQVGIINSGRPWSPHQPWSRQVAAEHQRRPFRAVLSPDPHPDEDWLLIPDDLRTDHPLLAMEHEQSIDRTAQAIAAGAAELIRHSRQIIFVDPYFDPFAERFQRSLRELLRVVAERRRQPDRLEYHLLASPGTNHHRQLDPDSFRRGCQQHVRALVPQPLELTIARWRERQGGEGFHARYVLTERGALRFDQGLDVGASGQTTPVTWVSPSIHAGLLRSYGADCTVHERMGAALVVSSQHCDFLDEDEN